jgi:hypothetical protein
MLIGFIGCPCSGKTTTAAKTFADLKDMGIASEFIPEQARLYIAERRVKEGLRPEDPLFLADEDQKLILVRQIEYEDTLIKACGPQVKIIADSSVLNTLLYMGPEARAEVTPLVRDVLTRYDLLFYCGPVKPPLSLDPNRIHDEKASLEIDRMIPVLLKDFGLNPKYLTGDSRQRHHEVTRDILEASLR